MYVDLSKGSGCRIATYVMYFYSYDGWMDVASGGPAVRYQNSLRSWGLATSCCVCMPGCTDEAEQQGRSLVVSRVARRVDRLSERGQSIQVVALGGWKPSARYAIHCSACLVMYYTEAVWFFFGSLLPALQLRLHYRRC